MNNNLTVNDLSVKFKSKIELYNVLTREGDVYLPPKQDSTQKFLRDIMLGNKLYLNCKDISVIKVPQYKELHVKDILKFAASKVNIKMYMPDYAYQKEPNREWLCNIVNTLIKDEFQEYINEKVENRKLELINNQNLGIKAKPEFINIFKYSQSVSTMRGKSHFLVRLPKISKDQKLIKVLEEQKKGGEYHVKLLNKEIDELKQKILDLEESQRNNDDNLEKLTKLYDLGVIDENGQLKRDQME